MNGVICIYKEKGYTSFDVVAIMRKLCGTKKIGHGGTLDPMAEGVLPIFVGTATKAVDYCPDNTKEYRAGIRFGVTTDTQDFTGKIIASSDKQVSRNAQYILKQRFTGDILQTPPMYSAIQVNGQRLYDLARKGVEVEREPRQITIHSLEFEEFGENMATILVSCSKGTYIRTLIHDMGIEVGTGAIMTSLVRTRSGNFTLRDCYKLGEIKAAYERGGEEAVEKLLMPIDIIFNALPAARLDEVQTRMFLNGVTLDGNRVSFDMEHDGPYRILGCDGKIIAVGRLGDDGDLAVIQRFGVKPPPPIKPIEPPDILKAEASESETDKTESAGEEQPKSEESESHESDELTDKSDKTEVSEKSEESGKTKKAEKKEKTRLFDKFRKSRKTDKSEKNEQEETIPETTEIVEETAPETAEIMEETIPEAAEPVEEAIPEAEEPVEKVISETAEPVEETISEAAEIVEETIPEAAEIKEVITEEIKETVEKVELNEEKAPEIPEEETEEHIITSESNLKDISELKGVRFS